MQRVIFISLPDFSAAFTSIDYCFLSLFLACVMSHSHIFSAVSLAALLKILLCYLSNVGVLQDSVTSPLFFSAFLLRKSHFPQGFNYYHMTAQRLKFPSLEETSILIFRLIFLTALSTSPSKHPITIPENNISLNKFNSQIEKTKETFSELEDRSRDITQCEKNKNKDSKDRKKINRASSNCLDNSKWSKL